VRPNELSGSALEDVAPECVFVHQKRQQTESAFGIIVPRPKILPGKGGTDRMRDQFRDHEAGRQQELIESMQGELDVALTFAKVSSVAFGKGKLQRAIDARSRAEAVQTRAFAELVEAASSDPEASHTVRRKLAEVRHALAHVPSSGEPLRRMRSAG